MTASNNTVLVGLTGSIGSGKSTVALIFERSGIPVLRADDIARELMLNDADLIAALTQEFGPETYLPDGSLNRPYLADTIFADPARREAMNALVHPRTIAEQGVRAAGLFAAGERVVACETALLFESDGDGRFDYIVVVDAERSLRIARAAERDGLTVEEIERRDAAQIPAEQKVERADFVIANNGSPQDLERNAGFIAMLLKKLPPRDRIEADDDEAAEDGLADTDTGNGHAPE